MFVVKNHKKSILCLTSEKEYSYRNFLAIFGLGLILILLLIDLFCILIKSKSFYSIGQINCLELNNSENLDSSDTKNEYKDSKN
jgi:hypothetical protein